MSIIGSNVLAGASGQAGGGYEIERSVRFNSSDSAYLSRTPASAGNRKTFTFSCWAKIGLLGSQRDLFSAAESGTSNPRTDWRFDSSNNLIIEFNPTGGSWITLTSVAVFRDASAWYHVVVAVDTTQATSSDRTKVYVNGVQQAMTGSYVSQNTDLPINNTWAHSIGRYQAGAASYFDGYLADIHFIDGQALTPSSFGEFDTNGVWQPIDYAGSYGLVSVAEATGALPIYNTTGTYGTVKGSGTRTDTNSSSIVLAVPMDGANNGTTFTDESATIKGSGSAKAITRNGSTKTVTTQSKFYGSSGLFNGTTDYLQFANSTDFDFGSGNFTVEAWIYPTSSTGRLLMGYDPINEFTFTSGALEFGRSGSFTANLGATISTNTWQHVALVRNGSTVTGYVNGIAATSPYNISTNTVAFTTGTGTLIGRNHISAGTASYFAGNIADFRIYKGVAKYTSNFSPVLSSNNSFKLPFSDNSTAAALGTDTSSNGNTWTVNNISVTAGAGNDSLVDSPTNGSQVDTGVGGEVVGNYATLNPLANSGLTISNGNLDFTSDSGNIDTCISTFAVSSGKWYWELNVTDSRIAIGIEPQGYYPAAGARTGFDSTGYAWWIDRQQKYHNGSSAAYGASTTTGDIIGVALDLDAGTLVFYKNNASQGTAYSGITGTYLPAICDCANVGAATGVLNFGQRPFAYTAPSGFKALCTTNLPTGSITTSGSFTGNANADGPFVYLNGVPTAMTINSNAVTFATHADKLSNGFKLRTSSGSYNTAGSNTYSITTTGAEFKFARAQPNP